MNRVLLVEGRPDVADLLENMLLELNFNVVVATALNSAIELAQRAEVSLALLEVNVQSKTSYQVADILRTRGIPFAFISSHGTGGVDRAYASARVLTKPFNFQQLREIMERLNRSRT
jgi:DNA-binding response OmpR family regulator